MSDNASLEEARRAFDAFFEDVDRHLLKRLHAEADTEAGRRALIEATGVDDPVLVEELVALGIPSEGLIALRLVPLVCVAWSQDRTDVAERDAVMDEARRIGIIDGSAAYVLLDHWLRRLPPREIIDAWERYMHGLMGQMSEVACRKLIALTERQMAAVAKASGGHFGLGRVSRKEREMIQQMAKALRKQIPNRHAVPPQNSPPDAGGTS